MAFFINRILEIYTFRIFYDFRLNLTPYFNDFLKNNVPNEKFIDLLSLISTEDGVPLFTEDNKLMSLDRAHLTYFGAKEVGKIIFSDIRLNDLN